MNWNQVCQYIHNIRLFNRLILYKRSSLFLSTNEIELLSRIDISKKFLTSKEIISQMSSNKVILSRLMKKLLKDEYIEKIENPNDKRSYYLKITKKGKTILRKDYETLILPISILKKEMNNEEFAKFMQQINIANNILKKYYNIEGCDNN